MNLIDKLKYRGTPYLELGGKSAIDRIVDEFYEIMDSDPLAKECRGIHATSLDEASQKLKLFLYGWLGGPQEYVERYGHPRLRMRHLPFKIRDIEAQQWLYCMQKALKNCQVDEKLFNQLYVSFQSLGFKMINS